MNDVEDFLTLLRDELGMAVTRDDLDRHLDQVPDWDSAHLVELVTLLERETGHSVPVPDMLSATSLGEIYRLAAGGTA
jgi:acyl carrier protein